MSAVLSHMSFGTTHRALLVLPLASNAADQLGAALQRALAQGDATDLPQREERLTWITQLIGTLPAASGLAALRLWGQTGQPPTGWIAGADPVYFEPRLDHLILHPLSDRSVVADELAEIFAGLRETFAAEAEFFHEGTLGYLRAAEGVLQIPRQSAQTLNGCEPSPYMPSGGGAAIYQRLQSEIQMTLHQSAVQERREREGRAPINGLWLWGGGTVPEGRSRMLPTLFSGAPLLRGYWHSAEASVFNWPGSIGQCLSDAGADFVAVVPSAGDPAAGDTHDDAPATAVAEAIQLLDKRHIRTLTCLFTDGIAISLRKHHRLRFWRRPDAARMIGR